MTTIDDCRVLEFPNVSDRDGNLTPVHGGVDVPFEIERVYYLYDIPAGAERGGHAHREIEEVIVAVLGSFDVVLDDGERTRRVTLRQGNHGLHLPRMIWRELVNFSGGAICVVMASAPYAEADYIRELDDFHRIRRAGRDGD
jgi:dTDP-4-dehydrorhamnose 3,5-epimerase-like enzyme